MISKELFIDLFVCLSVWQTVSLIDWLVNSYQLNCILNIRSILKYHFKYHCMIEVFLIKLS